MGRDARTLAMALALGCLLPAGPLAAWGGTPLNWLEGTQSWDTTPADEVDLQVTGDGDDGRALGGLGAQWGVLDQLQANGQWNRPPINGIPTGELDLRLREQFYPEHRPAFSIYGRAPYVDGVWQGWGGAAADWEPFQTSLALNVEAGDGGHRRLRLGVWTPYVVTALRLGGEASWLDSAAEAFTPQVEAALPGDISLQAGLRFDAQGGPAQWTARLSYEVFQNP